MSGGEQQRVALGRSLVRRPKILLLDEPLTNLDAKLRHDMRAELKRLHRQFGMTIVYATPDELEALSMGEEIAVMKDGAVVQLGTPDELYETPRNTYVAGKIGSPHMNMLDASVSLDGKSIDSSLGKMPTQATLKSSSWVHKSSPWHQAQRHHACRKGGHCLARITCLEPLGDVTVVSVETNGNTLRMVLPESKRTSYEAR